MEKLSPLSKADCNRPMSREESRKVQIDMLDALVAFCEQNGLRYFLSGGTLLGAIRHKGFIPWDDDIDVNMPRPDVEKLLQLANGKIGEYRLEPPDQGLYLNCCNWLRLYDDDTVMEDFKGGTTKSNPRSQPLFIDIFPIEGLPERKIQRYLYWAEIISITKMRRSSSLQHMEAKTICAHIFHIVSVVPAKLVGYKRWGVILQRCAAKYSFDKQELVGVTSITQYLVREIVKKKDYLRGVKVMFEGKEYTAPGNYDTYLKQLYGENYMKMPPKEKQKSAHYFKMYWKTKQ